MTPFDANQTFARMLAALIRDNVEGIAASSIAKYRESYSYSMGNDLPARQQMRWTCSVLLSIAGQIERCEINEREYETAGGDNVIQRDELLAPILQYT